MNRIKELRKAKKITQGDIAHVLKVQQSTISHWENEKTEIDQATLIRIADYFGVKQMLKELRRKQGLTQNEVAKKLNVGQSAISMWESGSSRPTVEKVIMLASVLNVSINTVVDCFRRAN